MAKKVKLPHPFNSSHSFFEMVCDAISRGQMENVAGLISLPEKGSAFAWDAPLYTEVPKWVRIMKEKQLGKILRNQNLVEYKSNAEGAHLLALQKWFIQWWAVNINNVSVPMSRWMLVMVKDGIVPETNVRVFDQMKNHMRTVVMDSNPLHKYNSLVGRVVCGLFAGARPSEQEAFEAMGWLPYSNEQIRASESATMLRSIGRSIKSGMFSITVFDGDMYVVPVVVAQRNIQAYVDQWVIEGTLDRKVYPVQGLPPALHTELKVWGLI